MFAGKHKPVFHCDGIGYLDTTLIDFTTVTMEITALSHVEGSKYGGQVLKITGTGFPEKFYDE
jgi:hypothetical protein